MDERTSTDDRIIQDQQEKDLGHRERPHESLPDEGGRRDGEFDKDRRPGVASAEDLGDLPPSRNAGSDPGDAIDPVPDESDDPRV